MSTLAGVVGLRNADELVRNMLTSDIARPANVAATLATRPIGSGAVGHATTWTPTSGHRASTVVQDATTQCVIACDSRIDNRDELGALLGVPPRLGDAALVTAAYLRWGPQFASQLLGAFAIAIWDPRSALLLLVRDQLGVRPLAYTPGDESIVFGTSVNAIRIASPLPHEVYTDKLLHLVVDPLEAGEPNKTVFTGIRYVPPASFVMIRRGEPARVSRYWELTAPPRLVLSSDREYEEAFRHQMSTAVQCRIDPDRPVASMLSGGLDSSAVTALASEQVTEPLRTYSAVESHPRAVSDTPSITSMIRHLDLDAVCLDERELAERFDIRRVLEDPAAIFDDSMVTLWGAAEHASQTGHTVLLTGVAGDEALFALPSDSAFEQFRHGDRSGAWAELRHSDGSTIPLSDTLRMLIGPCVPAPLRRVRRRFTAADSASGLVTRAGVDATSSAGRRLQVLLDNLRADPTWNTSNGQLDRLRRPFIQVALDRYERVAARHGVEVRHPFLDRRLLDFCLSLPPSQLRSRGWSKSILRRALSGVLPADVTWRPKEIDVLSPFAAAVIAAELSVHQVPIGNSTAQPFASLLQPSGGESDQWIRLILRTWMDHHGDS